MSKRNKVCRVALDGYGDSYLITVRREHNERCYFTGFRHAYKVSVLGTKLARKRGWETFLYHNGWSVVNWQRFDKSMKEGVRCSNYKTT